MKKIYSFVFILLLTSSSLFSQNKLSFSNSSNSRTDLSKNFKDYKILKLDNQLNKISSGSLISIDYLKEYNFTLKENKIISDNYVVSLKTEKGLERKSIYDIGFDGKYFINQDFSKNNQFVFSTFENLCTIYIKNSESEFYIEPLSKFNKNALPNEYIFYETKNIINEEYKCANHESKNKRNQKTELISKNTFAGGCKTIELAMSIDYTFYAVYGSVNAAIDRTLQVLNLTQANYTMANGLSDDVQFLVTEHYIVTCPATCNYWLPTLDININYNSFSANASNMFVNPYDTKIHWQNEGGPGSTIGLGSYGMCGTSGTAVVKNYSTNSNYTRCILSHEIGHNLDCVHNSEIMNATVSSSNIWSAASITTINNSLNTFSCFSTCAVTPCDNKKVSDIVVTVDNPNNTINATWTGESGVDYKTRLYNSATNTWSSYTTIAFPTNTTITYNFTPTYCLDNYKLEITPFCGITKGITEQIVIQTSKTVPAPTLNFGYIPTSAFCGSRNQSFNVIAIDGGLSPIYQWKLNGVNVGTNSSSFSSNTFLNGDVLSCTLTSSASCVLSPTAVVSTILNVLTPTILSNAITVTQQTICAGTPVTFTAVGTNVVSANPYYAWYLNGQPYSTSPGGSQGGSSGPTLTLVPANNGDVFTCVLYDGAGCHFPISGGGLGGSEGATSNSITISIQNPCTLSGNEYDLDSFSYYPNPIINEFNFSQNEKITEISFYNILGQKIFTKQVNSKKGFIDVSNLSSGTYFVKIKSDEKTTTIKILKK